MDQVDQRLLEKLKTVKDRVEYLLEVYSESRNDDFYLWLLYVRTFDKNLSNYIKFIPYRLIKLKIFHELIAKSFGEDGKSLYTKVVEIEEQALKDLSWIIFMS